MDTFEASRRNRRHGHRCVPWPAQAKLGWLDSLERNQLSFPSHWKSLELLNRMDRNAENLLPTRYSLLSRLHNWEDQESWRDFFDTYWRLIYALAIKAGLTEAEAQDVVQETVIAVAKDIHKFKRARTLGSFKGWLRQIIRWRIADELRTRAPATAEELLLATDTAAEAGPEEIADPAGSALEALWNEEWRQNLFDAAVERVKNRVKEEHYQMFDLYVVKQWPVGKVAKALGVNIGQVYLAKHRVAGLIKKEIQQLEKGLF
jgi:RNA polymerase sigma-70 factor (ECF subfamily)